MNQNLLIYFAIPLAVIILSAIFETFINCPLKVAGITFAILLIVAFSAFGTEFLVAVIIYTILSYITAFIINRYNERDDKLQNIENLIINNQSENNNNNNNESNCINSNCSCNRRCNRGRLF